MSVIVSNVAEHYRSLLSRVYSWMLGGFETGLSRNAQFFERHDTRPRGGGVAVDLGAGCGFQSIPLADAGFTVTAVDLDEGLLDELRRHDPGSRIRTVNTDLLDFDSHIDRPAELVVCMTDTLLHLDSRESVSRLFGKVCNAIEPGGRFISTFRDLSATLDGLDRFIPLRSDESRILTCFLEYEPDRVKTHDLLYERTDQGWQLRAGYYYKLRLSPEWVREALLAAGFDDVQMSTENAVATTIATKRP